VFPTAVVVDTTRWIKCPGRGGECQSVKEEAFAETVRARGGAERSYLVV
jgi:hypothetical protein